MERFAIKGRVNTPAGVRYEGIDNSNWMAVRIMRIPESGTHTLLHEESFQALKTILPSLRHANIAPVIALETDADGAYATYAHLEGETLLDWLRFHGVMSMGDAMPLAVDCLKALVAMQAVGILHGDICPARIVVKRDALLTLSAILIEPALAFLIRAYEPDLPGTPPPGRDVVFTSPEAIIREVLDVRSDLYSLGTTLYYCFTGQLPFPGNTPAEIALAHLQGNPKSINLFRDDIPANVATWLMSLMARDPLDRPATSAIALAQLQTALGSYNAPPVIVPHKTLAPPMPGTALPMAMHAPPLPPKPHSIPHPSPEYRPSPSAQPTMAPVSAAVSLAFIIPNVLLALCLIAVGIWYFMFYKKQPNSTSATQSQGNISKVIEYPQGRYVRIENRNKEILNFSECLVFSKGTNIAIKGKATSSSEYPSGSAKNGNDGNTAQSFNNNSCVHTKGKEAIAWWEVDLLNSQPIELVEVWNRKEAGDTEAIRLNGFQIVILNNARKEIYRSPPTKAPMQSVKFDLKDVIKKR